MMSLFRLLMIFILFYLSCHTTQTPHKWREPRARNVAIADSGQKTTEEASF